MIFHLPTQTSTAPLLAKLKWMSLMDSVLYRKAVMVYKSLNGLAPGYMWDMFKYVTDVPAMLIKATCTSLVEKTWKSTQITSLTHMEWYEIPFHLMSEKLGSLLVIWAPRLEPVYYYLEKVCHANYSQTTHIWHKHYNIYLKNYQLTKNK